MLELTPGFSLGQTTGTSITLDDNAAGTGWFIDTTPADNSEFLPTSNPYEWVAKEGSAAYGKMDMLSVLLHEYGHALGIEHSADAQQLKGQLRITCCSTVNKPERITFISGSALVPHS